MAFFKCKGSGFTAVHFGKRYIFQQGEPLEVVDPRVARELRKSEHLTECDSEGAPLARSLPKNLAAAYIKLPKSLKTD